MVYGFVSSQFRPRRRRIIHEESQPLRILFQIRKRSNFLGVFEFLIVHHSLLFSVTTSIAAILSRPRNSEQFQPGG